MLRSRLLLSSVLIVASFCSGQTVSDPRFEGSLGAPQFESGYVLDWDFPAYTKITLYGPDTKPLYSLALGGPGQTVHDCWAVDSDGAVARVTHDLQRQRSKIDVLDLSGNVTSTIDTGSYTPERVTFAPDHTIWTVGLIEQYDFNVIRHYTRTGEELGQALPWSQIAGNRNSRTALKGIIGGRWLFSANDRIGFLSNTNSAGPKWIEVSFSGTLLSQYDLGSYTGPYFDPRALTSSGNVYARIYEDHVVKGYAVLDRSKGTWHKITGYPKGALIGSDGDNLVFTQLVGGWTVLHEVSSAALLMDGNRTRVGSLEGYSPTTRPHPFLIQ